MKRLLFIAFLLILCIHSNAQRHDNPFAVKANPNDPVTYQNPIIPGFHSDPSVCRVGDDYYMVTSTFQYYPAIPVFHSKDLVNWEQIGYCLDRKEQLLFSLSIYACTIRYYDGKFYMITTNTMGGGTFFVTATNPAGPWSIPTFVDLPGIDPDLFFDDDGKVYGISSSFILYEIDIKTGKHLTKGKQVWWGAGGRYAEGPHIYKKDGYYYLMAAEGGTEEAHSETIARSNTIEGPYIENPANPILAHANAAGQGSSIQGVGHADMIQAHDGSWWIVFHGYRKVVDYPFHHILGRETCLAPVTWPKYGWPVVNGNGTATVNMTCPTLPLKPFPKKQSREEFDNPKLGLEWNFIQYPSDFFNIRNGALSVTGLPQRFGERGAVAFMGRRLENNNFTATTSIHFDSKNENEEAGLTLLQENQHFDLLIKRSGSKRVLYVQLMFGTTIYKSKEVVLKPGPVDLKIEGAKGRFNFAYSQGGDYKNVDSVDARYLSTETVGGFTGVYVGFYATGNGKPCKNEARFDYFEYVEN